MRKYRLQQELMFGEEDDTPIKEFSVNVEIKAHGIETDSIKDMLQTYANTFSGLIDECEFRRCGKQMDPDLENQFLSDDIRKGWGL
jgi:hypothetical protein